MKFSIVIPAYGQQDYLPEAIDSALHQTVPCEIIVVNDGSPDKTKEIAESYLKSDYFRNVNGYKVINQVNKGLASARNAGIMAMTGDIFLPLDSDDILYETCVEKMIRVFEETDADVVAPSMRIFGESNQDVILMSEPKLEDFRTGNRIPYASAVKKEALLECGGYSPKMVHGYEDLHLWFDLLTRGKKIVTIQEPLLLYRTKARSMWKEAVHKHHKELMEQIYKDFPQAFPI